MAFPKSRILSVKQLIQQMQESNRNGERFCFVLGSGASAKSGIPTGGELEMDWMNCIMGEKEDDETPPMDANIMRECADKLYEENLMDHEFAEIEEAWKKAKEENKEFMPSEYYFDLYRLRFHPNRRNGYRYLERIMEKCEPSLGYRVLALLLTKNYLKPQDIPPTNCDRDCAAKKKDEHSNQNNLVITTNFDSLTEDALFIYSDKKPLVVSHESLAAYMDSDIQRPVVAKVHRGLMYDPFNSPEETNKLKEEWREALNYAFCTYTPIVIGYGGGDGSLMSFLEEDDTPIRHGLYWCYVDEYGLPGRNIQKFVEKKGGYLIPIKSFDELMLKIGAALYGEEISKEETKEYLVNQCEQRTKQYEKRVEELERTSSEQTRTSTADVGEDSLWNSVIEMLSNLGKVMETTPLGVKQKKLLTVETHVRYTAKDSAKDSSQPPEVELLDKILDFLTIDNESNDQDRISSTSFDSDNTSTYIKQDPVYSDFEECNEAIIESSKAIELDPDDEWAYNNRGIAYTDLKQYDEAIADFSKAIELEPDLTEAYYNRGLVYDKLGKNDEAIADFSKTIELEPDLTEAYIARGVAYEKCALYTEALGDYGLAILLAPQKAIAYVKRGKVYLNLMNYSAAIRDCTKAIELDPNYATAYKNRAKAYRAIGKIDLAEADEKRAEELEQENS